MSHFASGVSSLILFLPNTEILNLLSLTNPSKGEDNVEVLVMIQMFMGYHIMNASVWKSWCL